MYNSVTQRSLFDHLPICNMKSFVSIVAVLATSALAAAVPENDEGWVLRRAEDVYLEGLRVVDLEVTDERFPGVTFKGTAESIYKQIEALQPDFFLKEPEVDIDADDDVALEKRQGTAAIVTLTNEQIKCDWDGDNINAWSWCTEGMTYLRDAGRRGVMCHAGPGDCVRISCSHGCGMFFCNKTYSNAVPKTNGQVRRNCGLIPKHINAIASECVDTLGRFQGARYFSEFTIGLKRQSC
ncbi:hypothetical protein HJFPF1_12221 [Paramyrothecium foliicola]|nr:hypothetical protein HJFPF1_12221 [Paramyrothecium foliicola]